MEENAKPLRLDQKFMMSSTNKFNLFKMIVETDDIRLKVTKDFRVINCPFTDTRAGTTTTITALLLKEYWRC